MQMIPIFYQTHLESQFGRSQYLILSILINLLQSIKQVSLEALKIKRFLLLPQLKVETIWFPIIKSWLADDFPLKQVVYIVIDRTSWGKINLLMISRIWEQRAIPIYFELLPKLGSSDFEEQQAASNRILPLFKGYKTVVLGDRKFCFVSLGDWLRKEKVYFCLRLKKNEFVELENEIWLQLSKLGLAPGVSFYLQGLKVTKTNKFAGFDVASNVKT